MSEPEQVTIRNSVPNILSRRLYRAEVKNIRFAGTMKIGSTFRQEKVKFLPNVFPVGAGVPSVPGWLTGFTGQDFKFHLHRTCIDAGLHEDYAEAPLVVW